jgi:glycosyltransferase involved in cell wall biosynthesis
MRIVHHFFEIRRTGGGVPRSVVDLVALLCGGEHRVGFLTAAGSDLPAAWRAGGFDNLELVELDPVGPLQLLGGGGLRRAATALAGADVLHLHGLWRPRNAQIARLARRLEIPYVLSPHGMLNYWSAAPGWALRKAVYFRLFERRNLRRAALVHATAALEYETARRWVAEERLRVVPLVLDPAMADRLPGPEPFAEAHPEIDRGASRILMLGRLHPHKRPELLVEAAAELRRSGIDTQLLLAGSGEQSYVARLRALAARRGAADRTHFLGVVEGAMKRSLYQFADLLVLPTMRENFGLVLFECLACGTPVITTRGADTWRQVEQSGGGWIVEPTAASLAGALAEMLGDDRQRAEMGRIGRDWVRQWLAPDRLREAYEQIYRQAAGG